MTSRTLDSQIRSMICEYTLAEVIHQLASVVDEECQVSDCEESAQAQWSAVVRELEDATNEALRLKDLGEKAGKVWKI